MLTKRFDTKFYELKEEVIFTLQDILNQINQRIEFEGWEFEDEAGNLLQAVDNNFVYFGEVDGGEFYELDALGIEDAIEIINILETIHSDKFTVKEQ